MLKQVKSLPNLIFFQNGLGQKRIGIEKTVYEVYNHYKKKNSEFR